MYQAGTPQSHLAALELYTRATELDPDYALARNNLDWATNRASEGAP